MFLFYLQDVSCFIYYVYCIYIWIWNKPSWSLALPSSAVAHFTKIQEIKFLFNFYSVALLKNTRTQNYYFCLYMWLKKHICPTKSLLLHHWSVPMNRECNCWHFLGHEQEGQCSTVAWSKPSFTQRINDRTNTSTQNKWQRSMLNSTKGLDICSITDLY